MEILNSSRSYSELYVILNILGNNFIKMLPEKLYSLIVQERDKEYNPNLLMDDGRLDESKISKETIALFAILNYKYFTKDENEKNELLKIYKNNELEMQKNVREQYNPDKIFENTIDSSAIDNSNPINVATENNNATEKNNTSLVEYKEPFFKKLFRKIKSIFKRSHWL